MITYYSNHCNHQRLILLLAILVFLITDSEKVFSQPPPPPRPISLHVNLAQGLIFGAFYECSAGGTITLTPENLRYSTGDIVLATGYPISSAIYELNANLGTLITISNGADIKVSRVEGGGYFMNLHLGPSSPLSPFTTKVDYGAQTEIRIGGTLTVGNASSNPPGTYSGNFNVTFMQQ